MINEEAVDWFGNDSVIQLKNETIDHLDRNCAQIEKWIKSFINKSK